jgi:hypothetical protein
MFELTEKEEYIFKKVYHGIFLINPRIHIGMTTEQITRRRYTMNLNKL